MTHISGLISECEVGVFLGGSSGSGRFDRLDNKAVQFLECAPLPSPQRLRTTIQHDFFSYVLTSNWTTRQPTSIRAICSLHRGRFWFPPSSLAYQKVWAFWTESPRSHENQLHWILATELDLWSPTIVRCHHLVVPVSFPGKLRTCCGPQSENKQNEPTCMKMIYVHQSNQRINPSFICSSDQTIKTPFLL